ncbi:hypothetical protein K438DRAFT_117222 [Mycena galopus ATCC 62051]|nr:hypothetical protein K438DRAFT_117222 [Mycena galopus ATCC 62051]
MHRGPRSFPAIGCDAASTLRPRSQHPRYDSASPGPPTNSERATSLTYLAYILCSPFLSIRLPPCLRSNFLCGKISISISTHMKKGSRIAKDVPGNIIIRLSTKDDVARLRGHIMSCLASVALTPHVFAPSRDYTALLMCKFLSCSPQPRASVSFSTFPVPFVFCPCLPLSLPPAFPSTTLFRGPSSLYGALHFVWMNVSFYYPTNDAPHPLSPTER